MRDKISEQRAATLHPKIRDEVREIIEKVETGLPVNVAVRITEGFRSFKTQSEYYAQGRTKPGKIITNAGPGEGFHNYGLAFDFTFVIDKNNDGKWDELDYDTLKDRDKDGIPDWMEVVTPFVKQGYRWGADWDQDGKTKAQGDQDEHLVDAPHLECNFGYTWRALLKKHNEKDFIPGTEYVNI